MAIVDITTSETIDSGNDSIVIVKNLEVIPGGRTLDTSGFNPCVIRAGHLIIKDASDNYKPMPVTGTGEIGTLGALTAGSGYTNDGTYTGVALTGGSGTLAEATIVVTGGAVTSVIITKTGKNYVAGDSLGAAAADIGLAGTGFAILVATVDDIPITYDSLPGSFDYVGVLVASVLTSKPFASIMVRGSVNKEASPFVVPGGAVSALPLIRFIKD